MLRNLAFAALVAMTLAGSSPAQDYDGGAGQRPRGFYVSGDYAIGEPHFRAVPGVLGAGCFPADCRLVLTQWGPPDFGGLQMDTGLSTFPEIKRRSSAIEASLAEDGEVHNLTSDSSLMISVRPRPSSDHCKAALWAVLRGLIDTLSDHPQVATVPLLRWAADQCDQPAEESR